MNENDYTSTPVSDYSSTSATDYSATPASDYASYESPTSSIDECVRENPMVAVLGALGVGLLLGVLVRSLAVPSQPENRALGLLEEIQDRLSDLADSGMSRVSSAAEGGADAVRKGVDRFGDLHLERSLSKLSRRLKSLFH